MPERRATAARDTARSLPYLLVPLVFTYVVYRPVVGAYFKGDDWINLQQVANGPILRYVLQPFGGHVRVSSRSRRNHGWSFCSGCSW